MCHVPKIMKYSAMASMYYPETELVDIELIKPENHVLKTIDFSSHVLIKCPYIVNFRYTDLLYCNL